MTTPKPASAPPAADLLRFDFINSLPHPLYAKLSGTWWPVYDIEVQTGLLRLDICGKLQVNHIGEVSRFKDADSNEHATDDFYNEDKAASAQVREAEPSASDWSEVINSRGPEVAAAIHNRAAELSAAIAPEPVPVAQGLLPLPTANLLDKYGDDAKRTGDPDRATIMYEGATVIREQEASLAACRADAERYRHLRNNYDAEGVGAFTFSDYEATESICGNELDAAIDAAIKESTVPPTQPE
jgi:hypothetical protein